MDTTPVDPAHIVNAARDALTVQRVFGDAYERDGALIIPVATLWGTAGAGWGSGSGDLDTRRREEPDAGAHSPAGSGEGFAGGGGFGLRVKPLGVYVVDDRGTRWQPTLDLNKAILGGQVVAVVLAVVVGWTIGRRRRR